MGVLDSSYIKALGVKSAGIKKIFLVFQDTLVMMLILRWLTLMLMRLMLLRRGGMTADSKCKLLMPIFANCVILRRPPARPYTYTRRCFQKNLHVGADEVDEDDYNFHERTLICRW